MNHHLKRYIQQLILLCIVITLAAPVSAWADARPVGYMPGVTEEMTDPAFWSGLAEDPDAVLATAEDIARINAAAEAAEGINRTNLKNLPETFDGIARNQAQEKVSADDTKYYLDWVWDQNGKKLEQADFDLITANSIDPDATEEMPLRYGIAVNRTELMTFPWDGQILDDPADTDFDYQSLVGIRVNEPVAIYATSADGKYYQVSTSCCPGWVKAEDIAICRDREEWLSAWDIPAEKRLVFWGDKMYTDYSNTASQTACRLITMGTVLERMEDTDPDALVINRLPLHNYAVYLPIRNEDGSYGKTPALINARERVSEDYLTLTAGNLAKVALASLGDAYGWGAGLKNEDCTSLNHSVFCCFGLDLPRNGTWQWPLDFPKAEVENYTLEEKEALLDALPLGTLLNFSGHQMMYLGKAAGSYYVVSTVSSIMSPLSGKRQRTRDVQINTLDIRRANGKTWMQALNKIYIPWLYLEEGEDNGFPALPAYHEYTAFCLEKGLIDAYPSGYFLPERAATVAEAVRMMWRIAGQPEPGENAEPFDDVAAGSEYEKAALWARETGVYAGEEGKFRGGTALTRAELEKMAGQLLNGETAGGNPAADGTVTRAGLAEAGQAVFTAWEAQHPTETEEGTEARCDEWHFSVRIPAGMSAAAYDYEDPDYEKTTGGGLAVSAEEPDGMPEMWILRRDHAFNNPGYYLTDSCWQYYNGIDEYFEDLGYGLYEYGGITLRGSGCRFYGEDDEIRFEEYRFIPYRDDRGTEFVLRYTAETGEAAYSLLDTVIRNYMPDDEPEQAEAKYLPIQEDKDLQNGTFPVSFEDLDRIETDGYCTAVLYTKDYYRAEDVQAMKPGDTVRINGRTCTLTDAEDPEAEISLKEEAPDQSFWGMSFIQEEEGGRYFLYIMDDWYSVSRIADIRVDTAQPVGFYKIPGWEEPELKAENIFTDESGIRTLMELTPYNTYCELKDGQLIGIYSGDYPIGPVDSFIPVSE